MPMGVLEGVQHANGVELRDRLHGHLQHTATSPSFCPTPSCQQPACSTKYFLRSMGDKLDFTEIQTHCGGPGGAH